MWGPRAQIDRKLYKNHIQEEIFNKTPNLDVYEGSVEDLIVANESTNSNNQKIIDCQGVIMQDGTQINSKTVIITTGTFLNAQINIGLEVRLAGRMGDTTSIGLAQTLDRIGLKLGRMKTGTPPRLLKSSIDFSKCEKQYGDDPPTPFSFMNEKVWIEVSYE